MSKPRVFISSTYVDLVGLREILGSFFLERDYEPLLFERGGIYFDPQKPLDESCYDTAASVTLFILIIGGRYGSPASNRKKKTKLGNYNSVTRGEYEAALAAEVPIYTFVDSKVLNEYATWRRNRERRGMQYAHVDNPAIFELIDDIYRLHHNHLVIPYSSAGEIIRQISSQLAHLVEDKISQSRRKKPSAVVRINSYRLFYFRTRQGLSMRRLGEAAKLTEGLVRRLEQVDLRAEFLSPESFPTCDLNTLRALEEALGCEGRLRAGTPDDFLSMYLHFYATYKGKGLTQRPAYNAPSLFPVKVAVFDFDGTLTRRDDDYTTWEIIWKNLGYDVNECARLHDEFTSKKITHEEWCRITADKFALRGLTQDHLSKIADSMPLVPGVADTLEELRSRDIRLYILSGSIRHIIRRVLGQLEALFENIQANDMVFRKDGSLATIRGTLYDFEGKATYLTQLARELRINPLEMLFVGNDGNDNYVSRSGAKTLCVNPRFTEPNNAKHWTYCIRRMDHMREILNFF